MTVRGLFFTLKDLLGQTLAEHTLVGALSDLNKCDDDDDDDENRSITVWTHSKHTSATSVKSV